MLEQLLGFWLFIAGISNHPRSVAKENFCIMIWPTPPWCRPLPKPTQKPWPHPFPSKFPFPSRFPLPTIRPQPSPLPCDETSDRLCIDPSPIPFPSVNPCPRDEYGMPCVIDQSIIKPIPSLQPIFLPSPEILPLPNPDRTDMPHFTPLPCDGDPRLMRPCPIIDPSIEIPNQPPRKPLDNPIILPVLQ